MPAAKLRSAGIDADAIRIRHFVDAHNRFGEVGDALIMSPDRHRDVVLVRHLFIHVALAIFGPWVSLNQIATYAGRTDHHTVLHARDKVDASAYLLNESERLQDEWRASTTLDKSIDLHYNAVAYQPRRNTLCKRPHWRSMR